eukprot:TRINITY_DN1615_c0_g1_i15.p3 TRINITY_DN1615_c0_g1~~TRINITY_DN1615_c0_g1_i15.p3  ORF type:complete len:146 (-),score=4.30 TRINITY_DN1615_c0_g1_i15:23-460(-)
MYILLRCDIQNIFWSSSFLVSALSLQIQRKLPHYFQSYLQIRLEKPVAPFGESFRIYGVETKPAAVLNATESPRAESTIVKNFCASQFQQFATIRSCREACIRVGQFLCFFIQSYPLIYQHNLRGKKMHYRFQITKFCNNLYWMV